MNTTRTRGAAALALAVIASVSLTGCVSIPQLLQNESSSTFPDAATVAADWDKSAPWLPADATDISVYESTNGDPASLRATSGASLDPAQCVEVDRQSAPTFVLDDTPDVYKIDTVFACGDWAVVPTDDGWYGWTPNHPDEKAASPTP